ncbi:MAG: hypothetical protein GY799_13475 [Desulfobulbaceae bacterium]|nr:hypothetical protein [Desulfobulbaceae bacterium]
MKIFTNLLIMLSFLSCLVVSASAEMTPEQLAADSEAYTKSTAKASPTLPDTIVSKVEEACTLLSAEGEAAYPKFKGNGSPFLYEGTYIWIHALQDGTMFMHPIKYKMEGKNLIGLKDKNGKRFFVIMNNLATEKGQGWVEYLWPIPGTKKATRKVSFVKKCTYPDGTEVVIGSGIYNGDADAIAKLEIQ